MVRGRGRKKSPTSRKKKHTLHSPVCSLLQIAPLLANESLEGCALQSFSSDAIMASAASKSLVKPRAQVGGHLPAWIALDVSKTSSLLMGLNGLDWGAVEAWELRRFTSWHLDFFCLQYAL